MPSVAQFYKITGQEYLRHRIHQILTMGGNQTFERDTKTEIITIGLVD